MTALGIDGHMDDRKEMYPIHRDEAERQRLNHQHSLIDRLCYHTLLHSHVPTASLLRVADIATGTGIWLEDLARKLSQPSPTDSVRQYTGFDISSQHFPSPPPPNTTFRTQNILSPFPPEFHSQYDLVNIRFLITALQKDQYEIAIKNSLQLLKPGGWLQWGEYQILEVAFQPASEITTLVMDIFLDFLGQHNLSALPCTDIYECMNALGCEDVHLERYNSIGRDELAEDAREWIKGGVRAIMFPALLRDGKDRSVEEARAAADELYERWVAAIDGVITPTMPFARVVGKKRVSV